MSDNPYHVIDGLLKDRDDLRERLAEAEALLRKCQPYVTLAVDNEYDGDMELVRGVAAFLARENERE